MAKDPFCFCPGVVLDFAFVEHKHRPHSGRARQHHSPFTNVSCRHLTIRCDRRKCRVIFESFGIVIRFEKHEARDVLHEAKALYAKWEMTISAASLCCWRKSKRLFCKSEGRFIKMSMVFRIMPPSSCMNEPILLYDLVRVCPPNKRTVASRRSVIIFLL